MKAAKEVTLIDLDEAVMEFPTSRSAIQPPSAHAQHTKASVVDERNWNLDLHWPKAILVRFKDVIHARGLEDGLKLGYVIVDGYR